MDATITHMETIDSTLDVIGHIVRREIKAKGLNYNDVPDMAGMSLSTLNLILRGKKVGKWQYGKLERVLEIPPYTLLHILEGDVKAIRANTELDAATRREILSMLATTSNAQPKRRKSDQQ